MRSSERGEGDLTALLHAGDTWTILTFYWAGLRSRGASAGQLRDALGLEQSPVVLVVSSASICSPALG